jgi:outer membrane protein assembly factor BamB
VSHGNGASEYDLATGAKGWSVDGYSNITTARRLEDGNTLLGANAGGVTLYEVAADKSRKSTLNLPDFSDLRLARRLPNGNTLLGLAAGHKIVEADSKGKLVWTGALTDKGYVAYRLANGHTIAASGEDCLVYDFGTDGKATVIAGGMDKHPGKGFLWFSGFEMLADGHLFVANWNGHGKEGQGPHAVEFDAKNNLVWSWTDHVAASTVTNVMTVEGPGPVSIRTSRATVAFRLQHPARHDALGRAQEARHGR